MWGRLSLLLTLCLLHGGWAESEGGGPRCQLPPAWTVGEVEPMKGSMGKVTVVALMGANCLFCIVQASRLDGLHLKLEGQGIKDVVFIVINSQEEQAQRLHPVLAQRLTENITLYKQDEQQPDIWQTLNGKNNDFIIYDRCGRLTYHISSPYSIIGHGHVESAIKKTYCNRMCGECSHESTETAEGCTGTAAAQPDGNGVPPVGDNTDHDQSHHHGHGHGHGHGHHGRHGHQGHHRGSHHGSDHEQGQQVVRAQEHDQLSQRQHQLESHLMQQGVLTQQMFQEAHVAPVRP